MKFIVKIFPEVMMKSKSVRKRFSKMLQSSLRNILRREDEHARVILEWDKIVVRTTDDSEKNRDFYREVLKNTPGIAHSLEVQESTFTDLDDIFQQALPVYKDILVGKTFCVRAKRNGKHDFTSIDLERYVGGGLNQHTEATRVQLRKPQETIKIEVENDKLYLVTARHEGLGGFPMAGQEDVLSLMSGGFDSAVSSYLTIKRGSRTHFCFFNLGGDAHEIGVKQISYFLWNKYSSSHKVKFVSVPFDPVVAEILEKVDNSQMGVVLKRMMMRAASKIAERLGIEALVTGEAVGQVSSQTIRNLSLIDSVTDTLILRPLIVADKQDIIDTARHIGTAEFSETIPEYCGVISNKPTVKAVKEKIEAEEAKFDMSLIDQVVMDANVMDIRQIAEEAQEQVSDVEAVSEIASNEVILDIRSIDEVEDSPLEVDGLAIEHMPFFKLGNQFGELDQDKTYLLYCDRGVMSKLQALYLIEKGYANVKVYRP
ncbi:tRNA uracil 4-sulfurtransferase ThiI [Moritella viscosa]|uniref:tRNA sulfurtransferase n=1 Tax=Moritella viscosa TaxID=80854 RepID=A0A090IDA5_9GAMM|nr:tRNA uracil 4-sulfurtransferase ThiI [Moritella viscosa]CED58622.1 thiamine biosynthesis protein ThiI [Moritella viscosa]SGY82798.1 tRNA sulfurtransferase-Sulfur carrier protein ThiS sulfurtransferase-Thiamine biosynthesis protein thiI-tRNA 4-thiouridine synthase [Moritella viscosa]SGY83101.1 tRNA sulfurtransferase-Sulfur carrier protein ThiS sulfurtransferase-Thiamine biosynthesis protein thiI-tRNA 4-thiouridine synthase [Moritella viscosa]SGY83578.1 tRNA sulfurtransferase-Sulfur carrier pr